jgi:hypothetical protein
MGMYGQYVQPFVLLLRKVDEALLLLHEPQTHLNKEVSSTNEIFQYQA